MSSDWETQELELRRKNADLDRRRASALSEEGPISQSGSIIDITRSKIPIKVELRAKKGHSSQSQTKTGKDPDIYAQTIIELKSRVRFTGVDFIPFFLFWGEISRLDFSSIRTKKTLN